MSGLYRVLIVAILLLLTISYVYLNPPSETTVVQGALSEFPLELDGWVGQERSFGDVVVEELDADDMLVREYARGEDSIWFLVVFHQNERYGAHDPLVCYRSQGWSVADEGTLRLEREAGDFDANWVLIESGSQTRLALYWWYTAGDLATGDRDQFFSRMARSGIVSNVTFGAFVRISTVVRGGGVDEAMERVAGFARSSLMRLPDLFDVETGD